MKKRGRILFVRTPPYDLDPSSYNLQQIGMGRAFCDQGFDFDFITFKRANQTAWTFYENGECKARYIEISRTRVFRWGINRKLCDSAFLSQYDLVISQEYYQPMTYWLALNSSNVVMYSGPYWSLFMLPFTTYFYDWRVTKRLNALLKMKFVKSSLAKEFLESKGYTDVIDIGVGLDTSRFKDVAMDDTTLSITRFMEKNSCLLYVGRLDANKNFSFLVEVFRVAQERYPDLKLVVIGKSKQSAIKRLFGKTDESFADEILASQPERVRNAVLRVEGFDNKQLKFVYPLAKVFLLASIKEIFGMVLLEAMYFGAPVVSSMNGGAVTLIRDEEHGQLIEEFDVEKWVRAISKYLDDADYSAKVAATCQQMVKEEFNWDFITNKILDECGLN